MRLSVVPDGVLERAAMAFNLVPTPLVQITWGMGSARCILAGVDLGIFDLLARGPRTAEEVASSLDCDPAGTLTLLNALNGFGLLKRRDGRYSNGRSAAKWLVGHSPHSMVQMVRFMGDLWEMMSDLEQGVRTGTIADFHHGDHPPEFWERYLRGLADMAPLMAKEVARRVKFDRPPERLLDVGGGHGIFSAGFCKRHEGLHAEVLDLPQAVAVGEQIMAEQGMADRVTYRSADLREADWGGGYDAVLLFNILHNLSEEDCQGAIARARSALRPGGQLVVLDADHRERRGNADMTGGFSEMLCFLTSGTRAYPLDTIRGWMEGARLEGIRTQRLFTGPYMALITGWH